MISHRVGVRAAALLALLVAPVARGDVILQYFESRWETIERRMPDVFVAGYDALWLPPPGRAETGDLSVGYDVFDRFDLGRPGDPTLYGTEGLLKSLVAEAHRAGLQVYVDLVVNHCGFRDHNTPGFEAAGSYPGFVVSLPGDPYGDFHAPGGSDRYTMRLAGLIDIAQEKNHRFYRHPAFASPDNIPNEPVRESNRALYPDLELPANGVGVHPFNTADPLAGDPTLENATGLLLRYTQWLVDVIGVDGFRIDAAKHVPEWYFNDFHDATVFQRGRPGFDGAPVTPFSFCEVFDGNYGLIAGYIRKDGFGNRDALDFPLYFALHNELNGSGLGSWVNIVNTTIDASDGSAADGSRGVGFVSSHDSGPPGDDNLAYAYLLMRPGYPVVYYNAREFGARPFPQPGRGDALGGDFGELIPRLADLHGAYARDAYAERWLGGDVLIYERRNVCLVGLNDNADTSATRYDQRDVATNFAPGTRLHEQTGNAADPLIDPGGDIPEVIVVNADSTVRIRVPRNVDRRGFVVYGPARPGGTLALSPTQAFIEPDPPGTPAAQRRLTRIPVIAASAFEVRLQTTDADPLDPDDDDNAVFRIDGGGDFNGNGQIDIRSGLVAGFEQFVTQRSPRFGGGTGTYVQTIDATLLDEGPHYLEVRAFRHRDSGGAIYRAFRQPFYVDRAPPQVELVAPANSGDGDVTTRNFTVRVRRLDRGVAAVHVLFDRQIGADVLPLVNPSNRMTRVDGDAWEFLWTNIVSGNHNIFVIALDETGRSTVLRFAHVNARTDLGAGVGDINLDGLVNNFDIDPFVTVIGGGQFYPPADINGDGYVNNFDIDPFVDVISGG